MPSLIWSPRAAADLQRLYRFLLPKNPDAAQRAVKAIRAGCGLVPCGWGCDHHLRPIFSAFTAFLSPKTPMRPSAPSRRSALAVALYRVDEDAITILAVRHQKEAGF